MSHTMKHVIDSLNVSANTLRFYEAEGLLKNISRDAGGRRIYTDDDLRWISFIRSLRLTGMPISMIKQYVELYQLGDNTFQQRKEIMLRHRTEVQNKINEYLRHLEVISYKVAMYELQERETRQKI